MAHEVLRVEHIVKDFTGVRAINDVSFSVFEQEIVGLIGENGAGKSTILKIINGVYRHGTFEGNIVLEDKPVKFASPLDALKKGVGFVPQEINVMDNLTVAENIFVGHLEDKYVSLKKVTAMAQAFLDEHEIHLDATTKVRTLSIAQKQMLMIARALAWNPQILILDEPTTALAINDVNNLFSMIQNLKERGKSIIFVTHKLDEIVNHTDRVVIMRDGELISTYDKQDYDVDTIVADMVGRKISNIYPSRSVETGEEVLRVENLSVLHPRIQKRYLIENVSFSLHAGEVLGLVGLVGSGRTETLETIFGLNRLETGKILIDGKEVKIRSTHDAIRNGINLVTEDRKSYGLLKLADIQDNIVISNLRRVTKYGVIRRKKEESIAKEYVRELRIKANDQHTMAIHLSGGNQQKVIVAKALNTEPRVLLLDEPTKGIDIGSKNEIYHLINKLAGEGMAIVLVSSELSEVMAMSDRYVVFANGKVVDTVEKENATQESIMQKCFA